MDCYKLEIRQIVDYPRCRIYREFIQTLIADRSIRTGGSSGLFYFTVLCSYANFRTSYRRLDGITYTIYPGEWRCRVSELSQWFRTRFQHQVFHILSMLQARGLIHYTRLGHHGTLVKFSIKSWRKHNTVLDYNCPSQKETGFFFLPIATAVELIGTGRASEMDIVLDLWISTVYKDQQVQGSEIGPVVYFRNGSGNPLITYADLSRRWGISRSSVGRLLKKLDKLGHLSLMSFPGRTGSVIYLRNYLSTMFQISDILVDKAEVAMALNLKLTIPDNSKTECEAAACGNICVSESLSSVSKTHIYMIVQKTVQFLGRQGIACFGCSKAKYMLYPLSGDCQGIGEGGGGTAFKLDMYCGNSAIYHFELCVSQQAEAEGGYSDGEK